MSESEEVRLEAVSGLTPPKHYGPSPDWIENKKLKPDPTAKKMI